jgi:hypothetical protein
MMIPKIIKPRKEDLIWNKKVKWVVVSKYECMNYDLCYSFGEAVRFWLWHCGVPPKIAFGWFSKYKQSEDKEDV